MRVEQYTLNGHTFHVGDAVFVPEFSADDPPFWAASRMAKLTGREHTIRNMRESGRMVIVEFEDCGWAWRLDWLRPVDEWAFEPDENDGLACLLGIQ